MRPCNNLNFENLILRRLSDAWMQIEVLNLHNNLEIKFSAALLGWKFETHAISILILFDRNYGPIRNF